jgi:hypothetical protein
LLLALVTLITFGRYGGQPAQGRGLPPDADRWDRDKVAEEISKQPLAFEENVGQFDPQVRYLVRRGGLTTYLTATGAVFLMPLFTPGSADADPRTGTPPAPLAVSVWMTLEGANPAAVLAGAGSLTSTSSYFIGNDPGAWHKGVPTFATVTYTEVYPGVDMVYYGSNGDLRYDFIVKPGADASVIRMRFAGMRDMTLRDDGSLVLGLGAATHQATFRQSAPHTYQEVNRQRTTVTSRFLVEGDLVRFDLGRYDRSLPLVIDPSLNYATFLGGVLPDAAYAINFAADYPVLAVTGFTFSANFPATPGVFDTTLNGNRDAFVTMFDGSAFLTTYLGGSGDDWGTGVALAFVGTYVAYITGHTTSPNFPAGGLQTLGGTQDAFVAAVNRPAGEASLDLLNSTYLGGASADAGLAIAVNPFDPVTFSPSQVSVFVTGRTASADFPTTLGVADVTFNGIQDAFVTRYNLFLSSIEYSTYLGGSLTEHGTGIVADDQRNAYITGFTASSNYLRTPNAMDTTFNGVVDAFVTKLTADGALDYSTFVGGSGDDRGYGIAQIVLPFSFGSTSRAPEAITPFNDQVWITGETQSANFPVTPTAFDPTANGQRDAFITLITTQPSVPLSYSTYLGSAANDIGFGINAPTLPLSGTTPVFIVGNVVVTGRTGGADFPMTQCTDDATFNGGTDAFVTALNPYGNGLSFSTFLGGSANETGYGLSTFFNGYFLAGETNSANFPLDDDGFDQTYNGNGDAFIAGYLAPVALPEGIGVRRAADGFFYLRDVPNLDQTDYVVAYGRTTDIGLVGDWNNDGITTVGFYRPTTGIFTLSDQAAGDVIGIPTPAYNFGYGSLGDIPVVGDWDGNGRDSIGMYRPANRTFYLRNTLNAGFADVTIPFTAAQAGDIPVAGDWNCDSVTTLGVFRPSNGTFYLSNQTSGTVSAPEVVIPFGQPGDRPVIGDWDGDSASTIGVFRNGTFLLRNHLTPGPANLTATLGGAGDAPFAGVWLDLDASIITAPAMKAKPEIAPTFEPR